MKRKILLWQATGLIFTAIMGPVLHFLYDWTNQNTFAALISGVNESTWEHMKLLFVPMLLFAAVESFYIADITKDFWGTKLIGILCGLVAVPVLFYTYRGVLGYNVDWVNIAIFFISVAVAYFVETRRFLKNKSCCISKTVALSVLIIIAVMFAVFTFVPPEIGLFSDPLNRKQY